MMKQKMVQDMMRSYSQEKLKPTATERDKTAAFPAQELKELGELRRTRYDCIGRMGRSRT